MKKKLIFLSILVMVFILVFLYFEYHQDLKLWLDPKVSKKLLLAQVRSHGIEAALLLLLLITVMCALPGIPTSVICIFVGVCYGPYWGSLINCTGSLAGNLLAISLFRKIKLIDPQHKKNAWVQAIAKMKHPKIGLMLGYMIPIVPTFLVNYTATLKAFTIKEVLFPVLLGVLPTSVFYALGGDALFNGNLSRIIIIVVALGALLLLVILLKKHEQVIEK
ncbi:TVP38/TMEM64 family protein [Enterococcus sp. 2201sp1_2201st1_B8_2201SCRN_220225]|uniref:TVP38/TMEM64 family protein n=1 Tax=unclassified Enterococcus TaxID=2608891 RepID=UPI0034A1D948